MPRSRIFETKWFDRYARKHGLTDPDLCHAVDEIERGLVDADLGGAVLKKRLARANEGKSGGHRSIVVFRQGDRAIFVFGFEKSDRDNLKTDELRAYKKLAKHYLEFDDEGIKTALKAKALHEVRCDDEDI